MHPPLAVSYTHLDVYKRQQQRKLVPDFFQLQRNRLRILHLCHVIEFSLGMDDPSPSHCRGQTSRFTRRRNPWSVGIVEIFV